MTGVRNAAWQGILSPCAAEALELAAQGQINREIALELALTDHAVKASLSRAYVQLGVRNRVEAVRWWLENVELASNQ